MLLVVVGVLFGVVVGGFGVFYFMSGSGGWIFVVFMMYYVLIDV